MENSSLIDRIAFIVKGKLEGEGSGHDWWHIHRVWKMAQRIGLKENADMLIVELAALLHDIADWKFYGGDDTVGPRVAREILVENGVPENIINHVCEIIAEMAFKGAGVNADMRTIEGMVVQDADRLDAIGAIGIARVFAYGGSRGRVIHDPEQKPVLHQTKEEYMGNKTPAIGHFYEKLLLLKDRMNTETAKQLAAGRHHFMEEYLARFFQEWIGEV